MGRGRVPPAHRPAARRALLAHTVPRRDWASWENGGSQSLGDGCSPGLTLLPSLPGLQRGWNSTPAQERPFQLCKTLHESLHVPNTCFRPVDAPDQADSPAAVLVRKEAAIWAGRRKSGPLGRGCLLQGVPRDLPPPWQPGLPWGGSWPSTGCSRSLWSSRWRKPRCPLCFRGHGWVHLDQLCHRHLLAHLPQPGLLPDSEE